MRTKEFEDFVRMNLSPLCSNWHIELKERFPQFKPYRIRRHHEHTNGRVYAKVVDIQLDLTDECLLMTICQDRDYLEFFYFGIKPDETDPEDLMLEAITKQGDCSATASA